MFWRALLLASVIVAVAASGVLAQAVTKEDLESALADLKKDLIATMGGQIGKNTTDIDNLRKRVEQLESDFSGVILRLDSVTEQTSGGNWVPNILGNMQNQPEFSQQMDRAVNESIHTSGEVIVTNHMGSWQTIVVNGQYRSIAPTTSSIFKVPVGTVTTQLPGYESAKNWTVGAPNYKQHINIRPRHSTYYGPSNGNSHITYSVPAQSYVVPSVPVYYNTWYYDPWVYDPWYFAW